MNSKKKMASKPVAAKMTEQKPAQQPALDLFSIPNDQLNIPNVPQPQMYPMQMQQPQLIIPPQPQPQQLYQQQTPVQQMNSIPAQQQLRMVNQMPMNLYQPFSNQSANISGCFNDDEELIQRVKEEPLKDAKIEIEIKAQRSIVKLKEALTLPAMVSLQTSGGTRTSVDLICVIDVSGSMQGEKIQLVKDTMKFLIETLTPADRLSIITFNNSGFRICGLKCVTPENSVSFTTDIDRFQASGGTSIMSGMNLALKTIRDRKRPNKVTSVFLLSDGQDKGAENSFKGALQMKENQELGIFSVHSFGFGTDHDEELMTKLSDIKDGSFYFIKELATLDEAFCNALGGIISLVASEVTIDMSNIANGLLGGVKIGKTFGKMWEKVNEKVYRIKLSQLMSGISKDYVFELLIPAIDAEVGDVDRDYDIIEGGMKAKGINKEEMVSKSVFKLTVLNANEEVPELNENVDVIENYLRVMAAETIEENMLKAEQNKYEEAQKGIQTMIDHIQTSKKARPEKMVSLVNDLQVIKEKCSQKDYQAEGKKWMVSAQGAHSKQANFQYSNCVQQEMVNVRKAMKKC